MMSLYHLPVLAILLVILEFEQVNGRYERVGYVSDPVELLLRDSYSSVRSQRGYNPYQRQNRQVRQL
ncbi:hypothetical protein OESDEN_13351 [Oesophagostomum dentatum]|uniref:Uncharacterized protein n=1 Tax=Oesophagostomum dentatum TaxID=61180 RepID=A0A0B1SUJ2_OESDE|nr:hypothetical protein OESDEN_13351 [Oesophagostomum dentatum]